VSLVYVYAIARAGSTAPKGLRGLDDGEDLAARHLVAGANADLGHGSIDRRQDCVLHLHRLEGHDRLAGLDVLPRTPMDGDDGSGHRRDEIGRARVGRFRRRPRRTIDVGRGSEAEPDASAGHVDVDHVAAAG